METALFVGTIAVAVYLWSASNAGHHHHHHHKKPPPPSNNPYAPISVPSAPVAPTLDKKHFQNFQTTLEEAQAAQKEKKPLEMFMWTLDLNFDSDTPVVFLWKGDNKTWTQTTQRNASLLASYIVPDFAYAAPAPSGFYNGTSNTLF